MGLDQTIINWLGLGISGAAGFFMRSMWQAVRDLQKNDKDLSAKVSSIEVLVAGKYITRDEIDRKLNAMFKKLDGIHAKLDSKVDK